MATTSARSVSNRTRHPSKSPGILLGIGLGGFVDGIVLHQILQWHHMLSHVEEFPVTTVAGLEVNTFADGIFHAVAWVCVLAGIIAFLWGWRDGRRAPTWSFHFGLVLFGWGVFNIVEGLVNHHLLQLHHVRDDLGGPIDWDIGFLLVSVVLAVVGWLVHKRPERYPNV